jgi:Uma2 family endonuclease
MMTKIAARPRARVDAPHGGETRLLVGNVPWSLYETFLDSLPEGSPIRLAYDGRNMEIMTTGPLHDDYADLLDAFFKAVAGGLGILFKPQSQTTWKRPEIEQGIEADRCYYIDPAKIAAALAARETKSNDVRDYPNPDLAIEVDISPPQVDREGIYGAMRVAELWTFDGTILTISRLDEDGRYQPALASSFLPLRADQVPRWLLEEDLTDYDAWTQRIRTWAKTTLTEKRETPR